MCTVNIVTTSFSHKLLDDSLLGIDFDDDIDHINILGETKGFLTWKVQNVRKSVYEQSSGFKVTENILTLKQENGNNIATCHLRDDWCRMEVEENDIVYVSGNTPAILLIISFLFMFCFTIKILNRPKHCKE